MLRNPLWKYFSYFSHILVSWFSDIFLLLNPEQLFLLKWALIALFFDKVDGLRLFLFHWFRVALNAKIIPKAYLMRWRPETIHLKTSSFTQSEQNRNINPQASKNEIFPFESDRNIYKLKFTSSSWNKRGILFKKSCDLVSIELFLLSKNDLTPLKNYQNKNKTNPIKSNVF